MSDEGAVRKVRLCAVSALPEGRGTAMRVDDVELALFRIGDSVYALENLCPHQHIPVLAEGSLDGTVLTCPMHGWRYDVTDGRCVHASGRVATYPVLVEAGDVYVLMDEARDTPSWW
jgi:NAD(P)H-dependent nitrite reductase small subunit